MGFIDQIKEWDMDLFLGLNSHHNAFFDEVMWQASNKFFWIPLYLLFFYLIYRKYNWQTAAVSVLFAVLLIVCCDQIANLFKHGFERYRPCKNGDIGSMVHIVDGYCRSSFSFISGHACSHFGAAIFMGSILGNKKIFIALLFWAGLIAYSRIYLGVHYPSDVVCGAAIGSLIGYGIYRLFMFTIDKYKLPQKT
jgi:undecaprenyl-diphosphatase